MIPRDLLQLVVMKQIRTGIAHVCKMRHTAAHHGLHHGGAHAAHGGIGQRSLINFAIGPLDRCQQKFFFLLFGQCFQLLFRGIAQKLYANA